MDREHLIRELLPIVRQPTGRSSSGWPYLSRPAWARLRDWIPHTLRAGLELWRACAELEERLGEEAPLDALRVVRQVVKTAAITAPPDMWLLRHVVSSLRREGWSERLEAGVESVPSGLEPDVTLLLARGYLVRHGQGFRWADDATARRVAKMEPLPLEWPVDLSERWARVFEGDLADRDLLLHIAGDLPSPGEHAPPTWVPTPEDLEVGYRLVPLVLGLHASGVSLESLSGPVGDVARAVLAAAGWLDDGGVTAIGRRGLERAHGPFGIIETYHPYLAVLPRIWREGKGTVHVERAGNIAASQDANRRTFRAANDALDRFCRDTGFRYEVFIEHAVGRGEATRQRYQEAGDTLTYVGADLEIAAIDGARSEQRRGHLPPDMRFVQADIGDPDALVRALRADGIDPEGAVMLVGNGFHEVRGQSDDHMIEVFRGYRQAGIVLLFTEESALAVDDLLRTAFNTYHAGFRYVHERSGQGLRPASPRPDPVLGPSLRMSWDECATQAGYVRVDAYCVRSRTIYPYTPPDGHNPSVSVNHFFLPTPMAERWL